MTRTITFSGLGRWGRWGNMVLEYIGLKAYAAEHGCQLQVPEWPGTFLFGLDDPPVSVTLPPYQEKYDSHEQPIPPNGDELVGHDFRGYAQWHTSWWTPTRLATLRAISTRTPQFAVPPAHSTMIGIHIRKGDYGRGMFYLTPTPWYLDWLKEWWPQLDNPVLYVASEDLSDVEAFAEYHPWTAARLGMSLVDTPYAKAFERSRLTVDKATGNTVDLNFAADWLMLSQCQYLVTGNSSFSFSAGMMNPTPPRFFRASLPDGEIIEEPLWNTWPMRREKAETYRHLPGVCVDETDYWVRLPNGLFREK